MPSRCCVPACRGNYDSKTRAHIFGFPKDESRRQQWVDAIQRQNFKPTKTSSVCEAHFKAEDIVRQAEFFDEKSGTLLTSPLKTPRLTPNAVPSIFPGRPATRQSGAGKRRKVVVVPESSDEAESCDSAVGGSAPSPTGEGQAELSSGHLSGCPLFRYLKEKDCRFFGNLSELVNCNAKHAPPEPWSVINKPTCVNYVHLQMLNVPRVTHVVSIDSDTVMSLYFDNVNIHMLGRRKFPRRVQHLDRVHEILRDFLALKKCKDKLGSECSMERRKCS